MLPPPCAGSSSTGSACSSRTSGDRPRPVGGSAGHGAHEIVAGGRGDGRGHQHHQDGVEAGIPGDAVHAGAQLPLRDGGTGVDGVARRGALGQQTGDVVPQRGCRLGQCQAGLRAGVGGEDARSAGVGDDGDARAGRQRLGVQEGGGFQEFTDRAGRGDAGLGEQGLAGRRPGGRRRGVGRGGPAAGVGAARVDREQRHAAGDPAGGAGEGPRVAERLQVQQGQAGAPVALPPLEHVVAADVVLVAQRDEGGDADPQPGQPVEQGDAHTPGLCRDARGTGAGVPGGERGVEAERRVGVGDPEAVRADEPHAVRAAGVAQSAGLIAVESARHDDQRPDAGLSALLGGLGQVARGHREDGEIRGRRQGAHRRVAGHPEDRAGAGMHGEEPAGEAAGVQLVQQGPAGRAGAASGAHHGHGARSQQRLQARHVRAPAALLHGREVPLVLAEIDRAAHLGALEAAGRAQAEVGEQPQHLVVLRQGVGDEGVHALGAGGGHQMLDQQGADAAVVQAVGDRDGDLGGAGVLGGLVLGEPEHLVAGLGEQRPVAGPGRGARPVGGGFGGAAARPEEAEPQVVGGHPLVEGAQPFVVAGAGGTDGHRGAVLEQGVHRGAVVVRHHRPPRNPSALRASAGPGAVPRADRVRRGGRPAPARPAARVPSGPCARRRRPVEGVRVNSRTRQEG